MPISFDLARKHRDRVVEQTGRVTSPKQLLFYVSSTTEILEKGMMMRRFAALVALVAIVACGKTTASPAQPVVSTATSAPEAPTTRVGSQSTSTTSAPTTTVPTAPSTTTTASPSTTSPTTSMTVVPYFFIDEAGHQNRTGPFVVPIAREVPQTVAVARASIEQLLAGPSQNEVQSIPGITTAIPEEVRLLGLTISEDIATIDLSREFEARDDSASVAARAAQVVFTLSRFDSIAEVLFRQEGVPVAIQTGSGELTGGPVGIWDYLDLAATISVETPAYGGAGGNPLQVSGFAAVFEATFNWALTDADGVVIAEGSAMTTNGTGWGGFDFAVDYQVGHEQTGALVVWVNSARDGERVDIREYPVVLTP